MDGLPLDSDSWALVRASCPGEELIEQMLAMVEENVGD